MAKENNSTSKVPNLRFPGFEGEWETKKMEDFIDILSGIALQSEDISEDSSGTLILRGINITEGFIRHNKEINRYYPKEIEPKIQKYVLKEKDLVLGMDGSKVGKNVALITGSESNSILIQRVARIRALKNADIDYIFQKFFSKKFQDYVDVVNTSSGIPHISLKQIKDFQTSFPATLIEQQKIASFLSLIDERIQTQNKILQYYQSLIQNLRESIFKHKISFKDRDGYNFPGWEICKLKNIAERVVSKNSDNYQNVLTISAQHGLISQLEFFNKSVSAKNVEGYYLLTKGDFAYNKSYSTGYPMGAIKRLSRYSQGIISTLYICFRFNEKANPNFMEHYFESQIQNNELEKIAQEGARNHGLLNVGVSDFFNIEIQLPSINEQVEIAKFLSSLNMRITIEKSILEKLKQQKQYLLQNLFI
ncbi:restriction endonuclease subunit S [Flavobacterium sp.]|uniref:restriction endonuclease subunit S n=1 Tax=Flavobacterium sp. TaxID=239 RepID=UPI004034EA89